MNRGVVAVDLFKYLIPIDVAEKTEEDKKEIEEFETKIKELDFEWSEGENANEEEI